MDYKKTVCFDYEAYSSMDRDDRLEENEENRKMIARVYSALANIRLMNDANLFSTFPANHQVNSLHRLDLPDDTKGVEVSAWAAEQSWCGHVGFGIVRTSFPMPVLDRRIFAIFSDSRDLILAKLRWGSA